jgi:transcriptional regulator with XRE-family HTH domain
LVLRRKNIARNRAVAPQLVDCAAGFGYNGLSDVEREGGNMTLGETIKARREAAGMTQEELAERLYVSRQAVSKWEAGASVPNDDNLVQIRAILGVEETEEEREQLAVVTPPDGQSCALAHISLSEAAMGQLQVSADWGGKSETSEGINIYYEPEE